MKRSTTSHRNLWALTVLSLLRERPMHPYEMQRLIRQRKNDTFLDLKRGSLYHAIGRLQRAHFIESMAVTREGRRPERTVYRLTDDGEAELLAWLRELLANPARDSMQFFAALSFLGHLTPEDALEQLDTRTGLLEAEVAATEATLQTLLQQLPRLVLLEVEYSQALHRAELAWARSLSDDLRSGRLSWSWDKLSPNCPMPAPESPQENEDL